MPRVQGHELLAARALVPVKARRPGPEQRANRLTEAGMAAPDELPEQTIRRLAQGLPAAQRDALVKRELQGLPFEEISTELSLPVVAVVALVAQARRHIRDALLAQEPDPE
ncbi:MAG: sigma factor-like helix-turn-helix DNA-binding protein [Candidatus Dormibacteria bacterium]